MGENFIYAQEDGIFLHFGQGPIYPIVGYNLKKWEGSFYFMN